MDTHQNGEDRLKATSPGAVTGALARLRQRGHTATELLAEAGPDHTETLIALDNALTELGRRSHRQSRVVLLRRRRAAVLAVARFRTVERYRPDLGVRAVRARVSGGIQPVAPPTHPSRGIATDEHS